MACCVDVAVVGVFVQCKKDDHVSNIYISHREYSFKEITDGQCLMVKQKLITRKSKHHVACLLFFAFIFVLSDF